MIMNSDPLSKITDGFFYELLEIVTIYVVMAELFQSFDRFVNELTAVCDFSLKIIELPFFVRNH